MMPSNDPTVSENQGAEIPNQRAPSERLCAYCQRRERWLDTSHGHHSGWFVCFSCIEANLDMNRRLADAAQRLEPLP